VTEPVPGERLTTAQAVRAIAGLTLRRVSRGRTLWIAALIAAVPVMFGAVLHVLLGPRRDMADNMLLFQLLVLAVLPPMFIASSIGEEIEDRTITYLWSRPIPRWAVVIGKLLALAPIAMVLVVASWHLACALGLQSMPSPRSHLALAAVALSAISTGIAVLVPRHGMALTIGYLLFDFWIGIIPASIQNLSVLHHVQAISFPKPEGTDVPTAAAWLVAVAAAWLGLGLWRIRRLEA
jgi:ABC-type transport system involved in multi-copper enzyme maturation permease subunit